MLGIGESQGKGPHPDHLQERRHTCFECRRMHVICDKQKPACSRCSRYGLDCVPQPRGPGRPALTKKGGDEESSRSRATRIDSRPSQGQGKRPVRRAASLAGTTSPPAKSLRVDCLEPLSSVGVTESHVQGYGPVAHVEGRGHVSFTQSGQAEAHGRDPAAQIPVQRHSSAARIQGQGPVAQARTQRENPATRAQATAQVEGRVPPTGAEASVSGDDRSVSAQVHRSFLEPDAVTSVTRAITASLVELTRDRSLDCVRLMRIMQYIDGYNRMLGGMDSMWLCRHAWEYAAASVGLTSQQWAQARDDIDQHDQCDPRSLESVRALIGEHGCCFTFNHLGEGLSQIKTSADMSRLFLDANDVVRFHEQTGLSQAYAWAMFLEPESIVRFFKVLIGVTVSGVNPGRTDVFVKCRTKSGRSVRCVASVGCIPPSFGSPGVHVTRLWPLEDLEELRSSAAPHGRPRPLWSSAISPSVLAQIPDAPATLFPPSSSSPRPFSPAPPAQSTPPAPSEAPHFTSSSFALPRPRTSSAIASVLAASRVPTPSQSTLPAVCASTYMRPCAPSKMLPAQDVSQAATSSADLPASTIHSTPSESSILSGPLEVTLDPPRLNHHLGSWDVAFQAGSHDVRQDQMAWCGHLEITQMEEEMFELLSTGDFMWETVEDTINPNEELLSNALCRGST